MHKNILQTYINITKGLKLNYFDTYECTLNKKNYWVRLAGYPNSCIYVTYELLICKCMLLTSVISY